MQTLLYVHACAKSECRAEYHSHLTTIHLVEDVEFLLHGHAAFHHHNLICRDSLLYQLLPYVFIQVEAAMFVLVVVGEYGNCAFIALRLFQ